ncbi:MAG: hypothetical protein HY779_05905, partial [Rubrobacteridae bacterium]|nr:hypothetical protein [Rubrobacteridae bacterium]
STADGRSICGHLGMCSQFIIYEVDDKTIIQKDLRNVAPVHGHEEGHGHHESGSHSHGGVVEALSDCAAIITNGMGGHFAMALRSVGINPVVTAESDPDTAVKAYLEGTLVTAGQYCNCSHN